MVKMAELVKRAVQEVMDDLVLMLHEILMDQ